MANNIEYYEDDELSLALDEMLKSQPHFQPIINEVKLGICYLSRVDDESEPQAGKGEPIVLKKVPDALRIYTKDCLQYVLVVDRFFWINATEKEQHGSLSRMLMRFLIERKDDKVSIKMRPFDFQDYVANVKQHGSYSPGLKVLVDELVPRMLDMTQRVLDRAAATAPVPPAPAPPAKSISDKVVDTSVQPASRRARSAAEPEPETEPEPEPLAASADLPPRGRTRSSRRPVPEPA